MLGFVIGHPRSGTQFISALLDASGSVRVSAHELLCRLDLRAVGETTRYYLGRAGDDAIDRILRRYQTQPISVDCNWKLTWILPPLLRRFPRARVLHLVRDPAENIRSCFNLDYHGTLRERGLMPRERFRDYWLRWMPPIRRPDWDSLDAFEKNCAFWEETQRLAEAHTGAAASFRRITLEELAAPDGTAALFDFFSLPRPDRETLERVRGTRLNQKLHEKRVVADARGDVLGGFAEWSVERRASFEKICGARARQLGYRVD